jgi:hypothetical protein
VRILTGNDLVTGDVIWWTGSDWSRHVAEAVDVAGHGDGIGAREEAALRVNGPYVINAEMTADGPRPAHIKDRIRAVGPTVRVDLGLKPADPSLGSWII